MIIIRWGKLNYDIIVKFLFSSFGWDIKKNKIVMIYFDN